ncbi:MAG TPA: hypothetical protein VGN88_03555, partial [Phycisphaerae bacterium]
KIRQSKSVENQIFGMVASAISAKQGGLDPEKAENNYADLKLLFSSKDQALIGSALASLIDSQSLSTAQLKEVVATAPDPAHRAMAAGELNRLKKLDDRTSLTDLLKNDKEVVRYYAAVTMLTGPESEQKQALAAMKEMTDAHDLRQAPVQALMMVRMQKEKITAGIPWIVQVAADETADEGLRYTAVSTLLYLGSQEGVGILADLIQKQKDYIQQVKLSLISLEFAAMLNHAMLEPLVNSKSTLAQSLAKAAQKAADHGDNLGDFLDILKQGHPIVLDWALAYSDHVDADRQLAIRRVIVNQATIVDNVRDRDYERAALAAQKILTDDGEAGRKAVSDLLKSENRAALEATLAGIYRSDIKNRAELVTPAIWDALTKTPNAEAPANLAALILAREGHKEALPWLPTMVMGTTTQGIGFRALAGWYYAKLNGQQDAVLKAALAD